VVSEDVEVDDLDDDGVPPALQFQHDQGKTRLVGITFDASTRSLDNPWGPHQGYNVQWQSVFYSKALGGDYDITTAELRTDWYWPTWEKADGTQSVFHVEFNLGAQQPYDETLSVPYSERYQLGGTQRLRGFDYRGVGPVDPLSGYPLGGETQMYGTFEWHWPIYSLTLPGSYRKVEALRAGVFFDYGVLDPESWHLDFGELRTSAGLTFGLAHPLPISVNFGFPVRELDGDERQTFTFTFAVR
jgi:outer membrane protein insertion porin family